jgi:membrane protease YdiL (CAAX protease family)
MHTTEIHSEARPDGRSATSPASSAPLREVIAFTAITFALAIALVIALPHGGINVPATALLPTVSVAILSFTMFRRGTRRELWRSVGIGRAGAGTWPSAFGVPLLLCGGAFGIALLAGAGHLRPLHVTGVTAGSFAFNTFMNFAVGLLIIMGEEIGWRGFMLPRIQQLTSKRRAALVTGLVHGLFHLPLILLATTYDTVGSRWVAAPVAVLTITAAGVFYAWLWDRSHSAWAPAIGHIWANMVFDFGFMAIATTTPVSLALVAGETGVATLGVVVLAAIVLLTRARVWQAPTPAASSTEPLQTVGAV